MDVLHVLLLLLQLVCEVLLSDVVGKDAVDYEAFHGLVVEAQIQAEIPADSCPRCWMTESALNSDGTTSYVAYIATTPQLCFGPAIVIPSLQWIFAQLYDLSFAVLPYPQDAQIPVLTW